MDRKYRATKAWIADTFEPLRPVYDAWMKAIAGFNWLLVRVVLVLMFFSIFFLYGIVLRIVGKDPMSRQLLPESETYWEEHVVSNSDLDDFKKPY